MTIKEVSELCNLSADMLRYYEKVGMIPPIGRTAGGIRNYSDSDVQWIELAKCMRSAGLPVEVMTKYLELYREGDSTIEARYELLAEQQRILLQQQKQIAATLERISYKVEKYKEAMKTGHLEWGDPRDCEAHGAKIN